MKTAYYAEYATFQTTHWWYLARGEILESILRQSVPANREHRLLDLGCGPGGLRPMLAQFGRLISTDFTFDALSYCRSQQLDFLVAADGMKLPFAAERFDVICMFDVLEHLSDDALAARELHRVLKLGGVAVFTVPAFQWLWGRQDIVNCHFRRYNAAQLRRVLAAAGFEIAKLSYFNAFLFPVVAVVRLTFRLFGLNRGKTAAEVQSDMRLPRLGFINTLLRNIFAAEKHLLRAGNLPFGVSLLCVVRKCAP